MHNKPYTTPVWWLAIVLFVKSAIALMLIVSYLKISNTSDVFIAGHFRLLMRNEFISVAVLVIVLVPETIVYWKIRYVGMKKGLVWGHLAGWIVAVIGIPVLYSLVSYGLSSRYVDDDLGTRLHTISTIKVGLMWSALIIGHLCFAMLLSDVRRRKKEPASELADVADDFLVDRNP